MAQVWKYLLCGFFFVFFDAFFDLFPPQLDNLTAGRRKRLALSGQFHTDFLKVIARIETGQEPFDDQRIDPSLFLVQAEQIDLLLRGDDRMMIGHLRIVDARMGNALPGTEYLPYNGAKLPVVHRTQALRQRRYKICSQIPGIRAGIRKRFMGFIQPLHDV